ncbi:MAG TPA: transcription elongation factor Spt5, partial [Candidatus Nanoarchaeia archaeon]|nr:transcription elongation factor Spt5 [Candidatus Nanoarchaeia archaeon]
KMADNNEGAGMKDKTEELDLNLDTEIDPDDPFATSKKEAKPAEQKPAEAAAEDEGERYPIFALRTTANREEQVMDFIKSNVEKKNKDAEKSSGTKERLEVYSIIHPHGMRGYLFVEAKNRQDAEQAAFRVPYARGLLQKEVSYEEIEHMLEPSKKVEVNIQKGDIVEIISGAAFKHSQAKVTRIDKTKEEVVVELLESAVPIPITLKLDAVKVIRRESEEGDAKQQAEE